METAITTFQRPPRLRPGGTIGVTAPSSAVRSDAFGRGLDYLRARGFRVVLGDHVYDRSDYLAGLDPDRAADLQALLGRSDVDAVICARGGYGACRMVDLMDWDRLREQPKIFIGYSDITTLHLAIERQCGWMTFHGPMVTTLGDGLRPTEEDLFWRMIMHPEPAGRIIGPTDELERLMDGTAEGELAGGCLTLLCAALGTKEAPDFGGRIVLLEDTDEPLYRVDRYLAQLVRSGCLDDAAGFVVGTVSNLMDQPEKPMRTLRDLWIEYLGRFGRPMISGARFGHVDSPMTLPLGCTARLNAGAGTLEVIGPAVL